jgi:hypothetical protein
MREGLKKGEIKKRVRAVFDENLHARVIEDYCRFAREAVLRDVEKDLGRKTIEGYIIRARARTSGGYMTRARVPASGGYIARARARPKKRRKLRPDPNSSTARQIIFYGRLMVDRDATTAARLKAAEQFYSLTERDWPPPPAG